MRLATEQEVDDTLGGTTGNAANSVSLEKSPILSSDEVATFTGTLLLSENSTVTQEPDASNPDILPIDHIPERSDQFRFYTKRHYMDIRKRHMGRFCKCGIRFKSRRGLDEHIRASDTFNWKKCKPIIAKRLGIKNEILEGQPNKLPSSFRKKGRGRKPKLNQADLSGNSSKR